METKQKLLAIGGTLIVAGIMLGGTLCSCNTPENAKVAPTEEVTTIDQWQEALDSGLIIGG